MRLTCILYRFYDKCCGSKHAHTQKKCQWWKDTLILVYTKLTVETYTKVGLTFKLTVETYTKVGLTFPCNHSSEQLMG